MACTRLQAVREQLHVPPERLAREHVHSTVVPLVSADARFACHSLALGECVEHGHELVDDDTDALGTARVVLLRTLQMPAIAAEWGVRSVATHGGTIVVAGGDDGVVHVWTLAEKEKEDRGDHGAEAAAATATSSQSVAA